MGKKPKGSQTFFGPGQVSLRRAQKEHKQAVQSFALRNENEQRRERLRLMNEQTASLKNAVAESKRQEEENKKQQAEVGSDKLYNKYLKLMQQGIL